VVREDEVDPSAVDVEGLPQLRHAHHGTFDMPTRPARAPGRLPDGSDLLVLRLGRLPEGEVTDVATFVLVGRYPLTPPALLDVDPRQLAVVREFGDVEIDRAVRLVCQSPVDQPLDELDHLRHVMGGARI